MWVLKKEETGTSLSELVKFQIKGGLESVKRFEFPIPYAGVYEDVQKLQGIS